MMKIGFIFHRSTPMGWPVEIAGGAFSSCVCLPDMGAFDVLVFWGLIWFIGSDQINSDQI